MIERDDPKLMVGQLILLTKGRVARLRTDLSNLENDFGHVFECFQNTESQQKVVANALERIDQVITALQESLEKELSK